MSVFKLTIIWYKSFNVIPKTQKKLLQFFTSFGVCTFSVSSNLDLSGLIPSLENESLKKRLSLEVYVNHSSLIAIKSFLNISENIIWNIYKSLYARKNLSEGIL